MKTENTVLQEFSRKDGTISVFKAVLAVNRTDKAQIMEEFKPSALQRRALEIFDGTRENPVLKALIKELNIQRDEILFRHLFEYGTKRELNRFNGEIVSAKEFFTIKDFCLCLIRYKTANTVTSIPDQITKVEIKEATKKAAKTEKSKVKKAA